MGYHGNDSCWIHGQKKAHGAEGCLKDGTLMSLIYGHFSGLKCSETSLHDAFCNASRNLQPWWLVVNHGSWGRLRNGWMVGLILAILVSCHRCSSLNPAVTPFTSLLAFSIPSACPLDVKITINLPLLLNSENSFMRECCCTVSDLGIVSDAAKRLTAVDLIAHPSSPKSLKSQLQIGRITFRWRASDIVLGLAMMVVIYITSVQLLSTFQRDLKIKHSQ